MNEREKLLSRIQSLRDAISGYLRDGLKQVAGDEIRLRADAPINSIDLSHIVRWRILFLLYIEVVNAIEQVGVDKAVKDFLDRMRKVLLTQRYLPNSTSPWENAIAIETAKTYASVYESLQGDFARLEDLKDQL